MPSIKDNLRLWNEDYDWATAGDEWSKLWGGTDWMWNGSIYPRIRRFLPAHTILEIAPGYGRCTQFLKQHCERLIVVDLSMRCIEGCKRRFGNDSNIEYYVNDGKSLEMIANASIDFVFSFDSLVHAQAEVIEAYVRQLSSKLKVGGSGFIHHSNLGDYRAIRMLSRYAKKVPTLGPSLARLGITIDPVWRGEDMTAEKFKDFCKRYKLCCASQELINWANRRYLIDAFSIFTVSPVGSSERTVYRNHRFMDEVRQIRQQRDASFAMVADQRCATVSVALTEAEQGF